MIYDYDLKNRETPEAILVLQSTLGSAWVYRLCRFKVRITSKHQLIKLLADLGKGVIPEEVGTLTTTKTTFNLSNTLKRASEEDQKKIIKTLLEFFNLEDHHAEHFLQIFFIESYIRF